MAAAGREADSIAARLVIKAVKPLIKRTGRLTLALDDTPTRRYGPHVQGAGIHHNPTPGPAGSPYVYGHVFVVLALLVAHPAWGVVALPLLARLYVRKVDLPGIDPKHRPEFRTKLELAVALLRWAKTWLGLAGLPIWVVADGAYANAAFLRPAMALGMTVVSRLRKDAALRTLPGPRPAGWRGRPRTYGPDVIDLAKRGGQRRGWSAETLTLYGEKAVKRYKTFPGDLEAGGGRGPCRPGGRADRLAGRLRRAAAPEKGRRADPRGRRDVELHRAEGGRVVDLDGPGRRHPPGCGDGRGRLLRVRRAVPVGRAA